MAEPTIQFGADSSFDSGDFVIQSINITTEKDLARAVGSNGDELASKLHNTRTTISAEYQARHGEEADIGIGSIGELFNGYVITSITVNTSSSDFARLRIEGHNHENNAHGDGLRTKNHGISVIGFGAVDFLGGTAGDNASVESSSKTVSCRHSDALDKDGKNLVGENYDFTAEATVVWVGVPTNPASDDWQITSLETATDNNGFLKTTVTARKAL